jgi:ABC-type enterochelin transport system substrate-binding protein
MMSPKEFMEYAGPVIILIVQQLHNWQSRKQADETLAQIEAAKKAAAAAATQSSQKLDSVHTLVNGNLTALKDENEKLKAELAALKPAPAAAPLAD